MPIYTLKLIKRTEVAKETVVFTFEKPDHFSYLSGQYGGFTLIKPKETDSGGITRRFSLLSSPQENNLSIITRIQHSAFKRSLNALPEGSEIKFAGPTGNFTLHQDESIPAVFIAGGIGIAPFYSMIKDALSHHSKQSLYLFYGNQHPTSTAFLNELTKLSHDLAHFKFIPTMDQAEADWQGERGFITHTMIKKYVPDIHLPCFYVCGAPRMVTALQELLVEMGIHEDKIKVEDFPGY